MLRFSPTPDQVGQPLPGNHFGKLLLALQKITHWRIFWGQSRKGKKKWHVQNASELQWGLPHESKACGLCPKSSGNKHHRWSYVLPSALTPLPSSNQTVCWKNQRSQAGVLPVLFLWYRKLHYWYPCRSRIECRSAAQHPQHLRACKLCKLNKRNGRPNWTANFYVTVSASLLQLARDYFILPVVPSQTLHTSFSIFFQKVTESLLTSGLPSVLILPICEVMASDGKLEPQVPTRTQAKQLKEHGTPSFRILSCPNFVLKQKSTKIRQGS